MHRSRPERHQPELVALRTLLLLGSAALLASACAHQASEPSAPRARAAFDSPFVERERATHAPPPGTSVASSVALRAQSADEAARRAALDMLRALLAADSVALQSSFAERVVFGMEGFGRPRTEIVDRCLDETRSLAYEPDLRPEDVVDMSAIEVRPAAQAHERSALPPGIEPSDLLVTLPPRDHGTGSRTRSRIACIGSLYVRVGTRAQIVGMLR